MPYWLRVQRTEPTDTWGGLERAAEERFWDGLTLSVEGRESDAVYLWGYLAEMLLKSALFKLMGLASTDDIWSVKTTRNLGIPKSHSLKNLADYLIIQRIAVRNPMSMTLSTLLRLHVYGINDNWREVLRYRHTKASSSETVVVYNGVEWLIENYDDLWR